MRHALESGLSMSRPCEVSMQAASWSANMRHVFGNRAKQLCRVWRNCLTVSLFEEQETAVEGRGAWWAEGAPAHLPGPGVGLWSGRGPDQSDRPA